VLSRVSGILAARGFNIDSLVVCNTEVGDLSRMNIVLRGQDGVVEQARRQLEDLVPVWVVLDYTHSKIVERELLLAKVSILGPEHFHELIAHHREDLLADDHAEESNYEVWQLWIELNCRAPGSKMDRSTPGFLPPPRHCDINTNIFKP